MELLVLGGTRFVGRALVREALGRGWRVTALNRGLTGALPAGVSALRADRTDRAALEDAVRGRAWDLAVDTWSGPSLVATMTAEVLAARVRRYAYVSSISVYAWGEHRDETSPVVDADPRSASDADYAAAKRGAELGVLEHFEDAVLVRSGLLLGPHEDIGRLPWWLTRIAEGGDVVAPGRPGRPLQYVDARDLARWTLDALAGGVRGPVDVVGPSGTVTTETFLQTCRRVVGSDARFVRVDEAELAAAGVESWTHLPCWVPEDGGFAGFLEADVSRALATGLVCRPFEETAADTWAWVQAGGLPAQRPDRPVHGLPRELERRLLRAGGHAAP